MLIFALCFIKHFMEKWTTKKKALFCDIEKCQHRNPMTTQNLRIDQINSRYRMWWMVYLGQDKCLMCFHWMNLKTNGILALAWRPHGHYVKLSITWCLDSDKISVALRRNRLTGTSVQKCFTSNSLSRVYFMLSLIWTLNTLNGKSRKKNRFALNLIIWMNRKPLGKIPDTCNEVDNRIRKSEIHREVLLFILNDSVINGRYYLFIYCYWVFHIRITIYHKICVGGLQFIIFIEMIFIARSQNSLWSLYI